MKLHKVGGTLIVVFAVMIGLGLTLGLASRRQTFQQNASGPSGYSASGSISPSSGNFYTRQFHLSGVVNAPEGSEIRLSCYHAASYYTENVYNKTFQGVTYPMHFDYYDFGHRTADLKGGWFYIYCDLQRYIPSVGDWGNLPGFRTNQVNANPITCLSRLGTCVSSLSVCRGNSNDPNTCTTLACPSGTYCLR